MKHYKRAKAHIDAFISRVDHPTLNWAWEIVVGVLEVVSIASSDSPLEEAMQETWAEFFDALNDGEATSVVHGCAMTLLEECPAAKVGELNAVIAEAERIGIEGARKRATTPKKPATAAKSKKAANATATPEPPKTGLRLVVNNTKRK